MKKTDLAYTAGIVDGEGSIGINRHKAYNRYKLEVHVTSTDEWLPMWLKFAYGGSVSKHIPENVNWKPTWSWHLAEKQAGGFLKLILPYLQIKRPQAELALKFQLRKKRWGRKIKPQSEKILEEVDAILMKTMHSKKGGNSKGGTQDGLLN